MSIVPVAPVTNVPSVPYPFVPPPFTDVAPLTYRDGTTYLEYLRGLNNWIQTVLIPYIADNLTALDNDYLNVANNLINTVNTALTTQTANINTALTTQQTNVNDALAAMQTSVDQAVADIENSAISVQDPVVEGILTNTTSQSRIALDGIFENKNNIDSDISTNILSDISQTNEAITQKIINPSVDSSTAFGGLLMQTYAQLDGSINAIDKRFGAPGTLATLTNALDAAESHGKYTPVKIPGVWDVGNGLNMNGRTALLQGYGGGGTSDSPLGSVIKASTQSGPVIDWTGWLPIQSFTGKVKHGGFQVVGSGLEDPTLANCGMKFSDISSVSFTDISIRETGGPCIVMASNPGNAVYLSDFERIILNLPVNANVNNVPYMTAVEPNGNRFRSFGLVAKLQAIAAAGAVVISGNSQYAGHDNLFDSWWYEGLLVPNGGTLFELGANTSIIKDFQFFDCTKDAPGSSGTSFIRIVPPVFNSTGANLIMGYIPGKETVSNAIDVGIDMRQSGNRVIGTKGYKGSNVIIAAGVSNTDIDLGGSESSANQPAVIDNSGGYTTFVKDSATLNFPGGNGNRQYLSGRYYGALAHTLGTDTLALNALRIIPFWVTKTVTFSSISAEVTTPAAGALLRMGIYSTLTPDLPSPVVLDAGTVDASTAGVKSITINQILAPGLYWLAVAAQGASVGIRTVVGYLPPVVAGSFAASDPTQEFNGYSMAGVSGSLPTWVGTTPCINGPKVMLKVA